MIKKLKKQLYNSQYLSVAILLILLIGFFVCATYYHPTLFIFLVIILALSIGFLVSLHFQLVRKQAEVNLRQQDYLERTNLLEAEIQKEQLAIKSLHTKIVNYSQLKDLTEKLSMSFTLNDTSQTLCLEVSKLYSKSEDSTVILYLFHSKTGELGISSSQKGQMAVNLKAKKGDIYDQWVIKTMKPLLVEDVKNDFRFDVEKISGEDARSFRSLMSVPLIIGKKAIGILRVDSNLEKCFETEDIRLLATIADLGAIAVENAQLYEWIEDLAVRDSLTGLFLRRYLFTRLSHELSRELRRKKELSFLMLDLDDFKQYNDTFGHSAGDLLLKAVASILADTFNDPGNLVCRYGGEEFAVVLPDCSKEDAVKLAETARKKIEKETIILRRVRTHITVSIGVATFLRDAQLKDELIQKADLALYEAKRKGKNRVCIAK